MEFVINLVQQTGMVIGIMACVTGAVIGAIKFVEAARRFRGRKRE